MDFDSYNNRGVLLAAQVVNSALARDGDQLADVDSLAELLTEFGVSDVGEVTPADVRAVRQLRPRLLAVFRSPDEDSAGDLINKLLTDAQALPLLTRHDGESWHLHYSPHGRPLGAKLAAEAAMGLASVIRADGFDRMRVCAADDCSNVFVDASKNQCRRFCNPDTCGNRATTAAYRARRKQGRP